MVTILDYIKRIQPNSKKQDKKEVLALDGKFVEFVLSNNLSDDDSDILFIGDLNNKGLLQLSGMMNVVGQFKGSSKSVILIIHKILTEGKYKDAYLEKISLFDDYIATWMKLNDYYKQPEFKSIAIDILYYVKSVRSSLTLEELGIKQQQVDDVLKEFEAKKKELKKKAEVSIEETKRKIAEKINNEPKSWAEVESLQNKKLLTIDFLGTDINSIKNNSLIDEETEKQAEIEETFINPLIKGNQKIDFSLYKEEIHIQNSKFDPKVFIETINSHVKYNDFINQINFLEENLSKAKLKDTSSLDRNLYKYLECKKIIDTLLKNYSDNTSKLITKTKLDLKNLDKDINNFLVPLKSSFEQIINAKTSKELIVKFEKYFIMKDKIEGYLKLSNFEQLADFIKKSLTDIRQISQIKAFDKDFYNYFNDTFNKVKLVLIKVINDSSSSEEIITNFRYLLEFEVDSTKVEEIINNLVTKIFNKIDEILSLGNRMDIKSMKSFFIEEFQSEYQPDHFYSKIINEVDSINFNKILSINYDMSSNVKLPLKSNDYDKKDNFILYSDDKDRLISADHTLRHLFVELKQNIFTMRSIDQNIKLKIQNFTSKNTYDFRSLLIKIYQVLVDNVTIYLFNLPTSVYLNNNTNEKFKSGEKSMKMVALDFFIEIKTKYEKQNICNIFKLLEEQYQSTFNNVTFRPLFDSNSFLDTSDSILDIFSLLEVYINKSDTVNVDKDLLDKKHILIKSIYIGFINNKIINYMNKLNEESSANYFEQHFTINNTICFSFIKDNLKALYVDYKEIINFYIKIKSRIGSLSITPLTIFINFYSSAKCLMLKLHDFYITESLLYSNSFDKITLLIMEMLKNINFLKAEVLTLSRMLFKNKEDDYIEYYSDFQKSADELKNVFIEEFLAHNMKCLLFGTMFSGILPLVKFDNKEYTDNTTKRIDKSRNFSISLNETHEKYAKFILQTKQFLYIDYRQNIIEALLQICNLIKELIIVEIKSGSIGSITQIYDLIKKVLLDFLSLSYSFILSEQKRLAEVISFNEVNQILFEFEILAEQFYLNNNEGTNNKELNEEKNQILDIYSLLQAALVKLTISIQTKKGLKAEISKAENINKEKLKQQFLHNYKSYFKEFSLIMNADYTSKRIRKTVSRTNIPDMKSNEDLKERKYEAKKKDITKKYSTMYLAAVTEDNDDNDQYVIKEIDENKSIDSEDFI